MGSRSGWTKVLVFRVFCTKHASLTCRCKSKDGSARNKHKVSNWSDSLVIQISNAVYWPSTDLNYDNITMATHDHNNDDLVCMFYF